MMMTTATMALIGLALYGTVTALSGKALKWRRTEAEIRDVIGQLAAYGELSTAEIAAATGIEMPDLGEVLMAMQRSRLIERTPNMTWVLSEETEIAVGGEPLPGYR